MTTVIITAAGEGSRWGNHLGVPKHLLPTPQGETLLARTVRLVGDWDPTIRVVVTGPLDERYRIPGAELIVPIARPDFAECSMYMWAEAAWNAEGRTVFLYGDTFYTGAAIATILGFTPREWHLFARFKESSVTGKPWPEVWAHSFYPEHWTAELALIDRVSTMKRSGKIPRASIYEMYKARFGKLRPFTYDQRDYGALTQIDDWTEDFDFPRDYDAYVVRYRAAHVAS